MDFKDLKDKLLAGIGQTTDSAMDLAGKAGSGMKEFAEKAADKAKMGGRIAKLAMDISSEKEGMKKTYLEIGRLYYDTHKDGPEALFLQLCEEITGAQQRIADKECEMAELKAQFGRDAEPDVAVEFEAVVDQTESEADCACTESCACTEDCACTETCAEEAPAAEEPQDVPPEA